MKSLSRRDMLKVVSGLTLAATVPSSTVSLAGMWSQLFGGLAREVSPITPNDQFFITSYRSPPDVRLHDWSLSIKGLVNSPMTLHYPELRSRPTVSEIVTLECVGVCFGFFWINLARTIAEFVILMSFRFTGLD